jgi:putative DNA methylase
MKSPVKPFSLKDAPALIERMLPVQKLSAEAYKEQMAVHGKTLTALGSYWKGRKPLVLNKACILGCLLPATEDPARDLEIFEMLMAMDDESLIIRLKHGKQETQKLPNAAYRELVNHAKRPEEVMDFVHNHIWDYVNMHIGTSAKSSPELVEQLGIMRFGHRPRVADTFCGSGQIPFEAARLGCDIYASDLNPIACMLTWGALHIVGGSESSREKLSQSQQELAQRLQMEIDRLGIETDGHGWRAKVLLYCVEARCPQCGWMVPLLPTRIISKGYRVIAELLPDVKTMRYEIIIRSGVTDEELALAAKGTIRTDGRGQDPYLIHAVNDKEYRTKISTLRGDYREIDGRNSNHLRRWDKNDFKPCPDDIFQERVYAIQWARPKQRGKGEEFQFRSVTSEDLERERIVEDYIAEHLVDWQAKGWVPDMRIEPGSKTDEPIRTRGWTYWHHLFNPRQLLMAGLIRKSNTQDMPFVLGQVLNVNARLTRWNPAPGPGRAGATSTVFDNQALNTLYNYGCRASAAITSFLPAEYKSYPLDPEINIIIESKPASEIDFKSDIYVTDPPYGDAVKYEEILEFFIAWLRKNPPQEFKDWIWDSRRSLAIKGSGEDFRHGMVTAYKRMMERMTDNGIQVIMFTHQDGPIWADMANIVWASGLQVTAAWYVVTETDSALREGSYVKGTVLLVCRKRMGMHRTTRDDLAWELQEEVESQVQALTGLNQKAKGLYRDENVFEDADIQMAGYAAALRVLTRYAIIDGRDMTSEAIRPRVKGEITFVDSLISFAVDTANQCLVPQGIEKRHWDKLSGAERFYLKMLDQESRGTKKLDNYQNFAKAFKVRDFRALMASQKANNARLKSAVEFGHAEMGEASELHQSVLRSVIYALMELMKNVDSNDVLAHLTMNIPNYYADMTQRELAVNLADYLSRHLEVLRPDEAIAARVLRELVKNQRLG